MRVRFGLLIYPAVFLLGAAAPARYPFAAGTPADEAAIRAVVADNARERTDGREAANLDWENAFGIRYTDLAKRDAFYGAVVKPLQTHAEDTRLEVKLRFIKPDVAVADEYWHVAGQLDVDTQKRGPDRWGRSTDVFVKSDGQWTKVVERIADLRLPYYKHLAAPPRPVAVPPDTLAGYAGRYQIAPGKGEMVVTAAGDRLAIDAGPMGKLVAIPSSPTEFTVLDPEDVAEYSYATFTRGRDGPELALRRPWQGAETLTFKRAR